MNQNETIAYITNAVEYIVAGRHTVRIVTDHADNLSDLIRAVNKLAELYQMAHESVELLSQQLRKGNAHTIMALVEALNAKDPYTRGHCERVSMYSLMLSEALQLSSEEIDSIYMASYLHDIGKIGVHEEILNKPTSLTREEFEVVKNHPHISSQIVSQIPNFSHIAPMVRHHHERHDGAGYPDGLYGNSIPLGARILAVADAFDAMTSTRPYRKIFKPKDALIEIKQRAGCQFDPAIAHTFIDAYTRTYSERIPNRSAS